MSHAHVARSLRRFGFKQTIRGAVIIGVLAGLMMGAYGSAIVEVYPTEASRQALVKTLEATPAINFLSGEVKDAGTPASYSIYKSLPMMVLLTSIWGLMVSTRLLRGNEEDSRMELLESGATTRRQVTTALLAGFGVSMLVGAVIMWVLAAVLGMAPGVELSALAAFYMTLAVFLPGLAFTGVGVLISQLTVTRGRAVLYGLVPLLLLFTVRGLANTNEKIDWLKALSPFGWSDLMDSVLDPQPLWIIPSIIVAAITTSIGLYYVSRRDYGAGRIAEKTEVRPSFHLLGSPFALALRLKKWTFLWWGVGTLAMAAMMAAMSGMVSELLKDSSASLGLAAVSPEQIKLLFVGQSFMFIALILLAMVILEIASIRRDEAKSYLDNLLVQPVGRRTWLTGRLFLSGGMIILIAILSTLAIWGITQLQDIDFGFDNAINSLIAVVSGLILVDGIGTFLYGLLPRIAIIGMTIVVGWAFVVDIVKYLFKLDDWIEKTSILGYIPVDPSTSPNWTGIAWMISVGLTLSIIGILLFMRRDITAE